MDKILLILMAALSQAGGALEDKKLTVDEGMDVSIAGVSASEIADDTIVIIDPVIVEKVKGVLDQVVLATADGKITTLELLNTIKLGFQAAGIADKVLLDFSKEPDVVEATDPTESN